MQHDYEHISTRVPLFVAVMI